MRKRKTGFKGKNILTMKDFYSPCHLISTIELKKMPHRATFFFWTGSPFQKELGAQERKQRVTKVVSLAVMAVKHMYQVYYLLLN